MLRCILPVVVLAFTAPNIVCAQSVKWSIDAKPQFILGASGDAGKSEFAFVNSATKLPDGNIMVSDRGDFSMFIVTPMDVVVKKFGRDGSGPGELKTPFFSWRCGSNVFVFSSGPSSVSVFALDGTYARSFRFGTGIGKRGPYRSACNPNGQFVHYAWDDTKGTQRGIPFRSMVPAWIAPSDSSSGRLIATVKGSERLDNGPLPLGRETRVAIGRDRVYVGEADTYDIRVFTLDGKSLPAIHKNAKPVAVSARDIKDDQDRTVAMMGEKYRKMIEGDYAGKPLPTTLPPYRELVVDSEDNLWVRDYASSGGSVLWTVFSPAGKQLVELQLPNALEVFEIGRDYILGRFISEEAGVPEVRSYRLSRK